MNPMRVPLLDLAAHHAPLRAELDLALARVMDSGRFIMGPEVEGFERELASACGAGFAIGMSSGTDALLACLMALDVKPGDEIVTTPYTFFATAGVIARLGAVPVFVDIDPATFCIDAKRLEAAITPRTKAVIPVHLYGRLANMDTIMRFADAKRVPVIEDACQAIGATDGRSPKQAGTIGRAGALSFFPTKNLGALGDAGAVITNDPEFAKRLRNIRVHGGERKYHHDTVGGNFRLDALQAAALRIKLPRLKGWTAARVAHAQAYAKLFAEAGLPGATGLVLPTIMAGHAVNQYVVRTPRRDEMRAFLAAREIDTEIYYPVPLHLQECFTALGKSAGDFPNSERAANETLALPVYPELSEPQLRFVVDSIRSFLIP